MLSWARKDSFATWLSSNTAPRWSPHQEERDKIKKRGYLLNRTAITLGRIASVALADLFCGSPLSDAATQPDTVLGSDADACSDR